MGRRRTVNRDLPARLYLKRDGYYYRDLNRRETKVAPADDLPKALIEWAQREGVRLNPDAVTFAAVAGKFREQHIPTKAAKTQRDYLRQLDNLVGVFGASALDSVTPSDVAEYRRIRSAKAATQANREMALLSKLWNWAREHGYTTQPNPCQGVTRNRERGRDVYMSDAVYSAILLAGDQSVKDSMRIGKLTGADIGVILKATTRQVEGDILRMQRTKTGAAVRFRLRDEDGALNELGKLLDELRTRKRTATSIYLIQDASGQAVPYNTFVKRFGRAREASGVGHEYQFRDLRPKVATDLEDIERAQATLGHKQIATTQRHYIRRGKLVDPAK